MRPTYSRISAGVKPGYGSGVSMTQPTCCIALLWSAISMPPILTLPEVGLRRPVMAFSVVLLPAPFGPRRPMNSPRLTVRFTSEMAAKLPYIFVRPTASMAGVLSMI